MLNFIKFYAVRIGIAIIGIVGGLALVVMLDYYKRSKDGK